MNNPVTKDGQEAFKPANSGVVDDDSRKLDQEEQPLQK